MATVNILYRSTRYSAFLYVRLQFSHEKKNFIVEAKTEKKVRKSVWFYYFLKHSPINFKPDRLKKIKENIEDKTTTDRQKKDGAAELNSLKNNLENFVLSRFEKLATTQYNYEYLNPWFQNVVNEYFNPDLKRASRNVPTDLLNFIDYYIESEDLSSTMVKKYNVLKSKLTNFQNYRRKPIEISEIDNFFRKEFVEYSRDVGQYSGHTIYRDFGYINTLCASAGREGIVLAKKYKDFKAPTVKKIIHEILTPDEILRIENADGLSESLDNVRDLFLVSYYTGQRISDFMNFNETMIREQDGQKLLEFEQSKTGELMSIPIVPKLEKILQKRDGKFPRKISDVKYNEYLKKLLKKAGFTELVMGRKLIEVTEGVWRKQELELPRYEFFSSHAGRRSFASNAFGKMPISDIMHITGHTIEKTFLIYVNKKKPDRALEAAPKLAALFKDDTKEKELMNQLQELVKEQKIDIETLLKTLKQK